MGTLTIHSVDTALKDCLRVVAAAHGRSMEEEVRVILRNVLAQPVSQAGLGSRVHARFAVLGGADFALPVRTDQARPVNFESPDFRA